MSQSTDLTDDEYELFAKNQQLHRERFNIMKTFGDFDSFQEVANLTEDIGNAHFNPGHETRFQREIKLLGFENAFDNFLCRCVVLEHSEASETIEEARLEKRSISLLLEEQADVLIRTLNLMTNLLHVGKEKGELGANLGIGHVVAEKVAKNIERPPSHGGKRF